MAVLELRAVRKSFGHHEIIHGIDLKVDDGEFLALVGPSGCGKSTLLRIIAGLEDLTSGSFLINGKAAGHLPPAKRNLAMVFQNYSLYPHMTVAENMAFSLRLAGVSKATRDAKVAAVAKLLGLEELLRRKPAQLSGGQSQRVAIGRAIVRQPQAFLFDEPLSNLDSALRTQMRLELVRLHRELQTTMIYVTHDQVEAMTMADRIAVLNAGHLEQAGLAMELYQSPANLFVAGFLGSPRMNFFPATLEAAGQDSVAIRLPGGLLLELALGMDALERGAPLTLGLRPEHLFVANQGPLLGIVRLLEHLGSRTNVHLTTHHGIALQMQVSGDTRISEGVDLSINFLVEHCHLFDHTGRRVSTRVLPHSGSATTLLKSPTIIAG